MKKIKIVFYMMIAVLCFSSSNTFSQPAITEITQEDRVNRVESAVQGMVQSHKYKLGIFRIRPSLSVNSGYDSNALYREEVPVGDYFVAVVPAASVGLRLGRKAFIRLIEQLHFVYYKELEQRRDIFNSTRGEFLTGTRRLLATIDGGYLKQKAPLDEEVDVPVDQEREDGGTRMEYTLTKKIDLRSSFRLSRTKLKADEEVIDLSLPLHDRRTISLGMGMDYQVKQNIEMIGDFVVSQSKALETGIITDYWSVLEGVRISGGRLAGIAGIGYGESDSGENSRRKNFLIDASMDFRLERRLRVGGFVSRRYEFSAFLDNALRLTTQWGLRASVPLSGRFSVSGSYAVGKNDYGDNPVGGEQITKDNFQYGTLGLNIKIIHNLSLRLGGTYLKRDTDISGLDKEQFTYLIGLGYSVNF